MDFTGGTVVEVKFSQEAQLPAMREALNQAQLEGAVVQHFGSNRDVLIRMAPKGEVSQQSIADGVLKAAKQLDGQAQLTRVITSYSIHYTKLYDGRVSLVEHGVIIGAGPVINLIPPRWLNRLVPVLL